MTLLTIADRDAERRTAVVRGLTNLAAFVAAHPELPLGGPYSESPVKVFVHGRTDAENRAEVDRIAGILGVTAGYSHPGCTQYTALRNFGGGIEYMALAIAAKPIGAVA